MSIQTDENSHNHYIGKRDRKRQKIEKEGKNNSHHLGFAYSITLDCPQHVYKIWRLQHFNIDRCWADMIEKLTGKEEKWTNKGTDMPYVADSLMFVCSFPCFMSQVNSYGHGGMVSPPNHTFSWAGLSKWLTSIRAHTFACNWQQPFLNESAEGRRMMVEIKSWSISTKVWYRAMNHLPTPGSAVRHASVARHVTDCTTRLIL